MSVLTYHLFAFLRLLESTIASATATELSAIRLGCWAGVIVWNVEGGKRHGEVLEYVFYIHSEMSSPDDDDDDGVDSPFVASNPSPCFSRSSSFESMLRFGGRIVVVSSRANWSSWFEADVSSRRTWCSTPATESLPLTLSCWCPGERRPRLSRFGEWSRSVRALSNYLRAHV